ncbi:MAG: SDR family NAD(P)-dependent oxidoreductase [Paracoccaceae bacterium]|nr:SDR family NAD(P)-dependent oxidoreductase [Paracoccaceae bacterium]
MTTALVTGGSRGVGKGVVEGLSEAGFEVFVTGRNKTRLEAVETEASSLAGAVTSRCTDHSDDEQVRALFDEIGDLDLLVNCAWGGYENMVEAGEFTWPYPFWMQPLWRWDAMMQVGVRSAYVASQLAIRSMLKRGNGLIVNISFWSAQKHLGNTVYGMAKAATDKMTSDMAAELQAAGQNGIQVVSLYPGLVRTERVMEHAAFMDLSNSESPRFIGRVIAALMKNEQARAESNGIVRVAAELAVSLGVKDVDGKLPTPLRLEDA